MKNKIYFGKPTREIPYLVASAGLGGTIDLEKAACTLDKAMYEPKHFPGLIYRMDEPKVIMLLFASGKLVCTGTKTKDGVYKAVQKLNALLEEKALFFYE